MSEVKVNKVSPRSGTGVQLGDSGDTITVPSGANIALPNTSVADFLGIIFLVLYKFLHQFVFVYVCS